MKITKVSKLLLILLIHVTKYAVYRLINIKEKQTNRENKDRVWVKVIKLKLKHSTLDKNTFYCVEDALLCTLHIENRTWLTTLNLLFLEGKGNCDNGWIFSSLSQKVTRRWKEYVSSITDIINNEILESEQYPSQWTFLLSENQKGISTLCLDNNRIRCIIQNMYSLVTFLLLIKIVL